jgi:hypothetical protein
MHHKLVISTSPRKFKRFVRASRLAEGRHNVAAKRASRKENDLVEDGAAVDRWSGEGGASGVSQERGQS